MIMNGIVSPLWHYQYLGIMLGQVHCRSSAVCQQNSLPRPSPRCKTRNIFRHCKMSPGRQNHPQLKTTDIKDVQPHLRLNKNGKKLLFIYSISKHWVLLHSLLGRVWRSSTHTVDKSANWYKLFERLFGNVYQTLKVCIHNNSTILPLTIYNMNMLTKYDKI